MKIYPRLKKEKVKFKEPIWLISYLDMVTNLLAIFILLFAISKVDMQKFDAITRKVRNTTVKVDSLEELQKKLNKQIKERNLDSLVTTSLNLSGLEVNFLNGFMFESAKAVINSDAVSQSEPIFSLIAGIDSNYYLSLEGHSDDVPLSKNSEFKDNWDLSSARGVSLLKKMKELGIPEKRMSVAGFADTRPMVPITDLKDAELEKARAFNRRVVIRIYR